MSKRTYGILAGIIGVGAWLWSRHRINSDRNLEIARGRVIFHNTPEPTPLSGEGLI